MIRVRVITDIVKELREQVAIVNREPIPSTPEQQEAFFQECVAEGEKLAVMGMSTIPQSSFPPVHQELASPVTVTLFYPSMCTR